MTRQIVTDWRAEVIKADPEWQQKYARGPEYRFSNNRVFVATYATRGAYGPEYD